VGMGVAGSRAGTDNQKEFCFCVILEE